MTLLSASEDGQLAVFDLSTGVDEDDAFQVCWAPPPPLQAVPEVNCQIKISGNDAKLMACQGVQA